MAKIVYNDYTVCICIFSYSACFKKISCSLIEKSIFEESETEIVCVASEYIFGKAIDDWNVYINEFVENSISYLNIKLSLVEYIVTVIRCRRYRVQIFFHTDIFVM